jgi:hypothetical protein
MDCEIILFPSNLPQGKDEKYGRVYQKAPAFTIAFLWPFYGLDKE